jgi:hypothetical protein
MGQRGQHSGYRNRRREPRIRETCAQVRRPDQNASEVLREGLRLVEGQEAEGKARIKALRDAARVGIADIEAGQYRTFNAPAD